MLHISAVTAGVILAPGNNRSIGKNSCICFRRALDLLYVLQPMLHSGGIAAILSMAPNDYRAVSTDKQALLPLKRLTETLTAMIGD